MFEVLLSYSLNIVKPIDLFNMSCDIMPQSNASEESNSKLHKQSAERAEGDIEVQAEAESDLREQIKICVFLISLASLIVFWIYSAYEYDFAEDKDAKRLWFWLMLVSALLTAILYSIVLHWPHWIAT